MFGRGFLLSTFIFAVIFASTVYSGELVGCENQSAETLAQMLKEDTEAGRPPRCGAESIGYGLGLLVVAFFANVFLQ